jgi:hypothetical protein
MEMTERLSFPVRQASLRAASFKLDRRREKRARRSNPRLRTDETMASAERKEAGQQDVSGTFAPERGNGNSIDLGTLSI